jgi:hypothetical protein
MTCMQKLPNTLFHSIFQNISGRALWVPFLGAWGGTVAPGEIFHVPGDPRMLDRYGRQDWYSPAAILRQMLEERVIICISTPPGILLDPADVNMTTNLPITGPGQTYPDVETNTIQANTTSTNIADADTADAGVVESSTGTGERVLPVIVPTVTYAAGLDRFTIDWSEAAGLLPTDAFAVRVTGPGGHMNTVIAASNTLITYNAAAGPGMYSFAVILTAADGETQTGTTVSGTAT